MSDNAGEKKLQEKITKQAEKISDQDIKKLIDQKARLFEKIGSLPQKFKKFQKQVKLLFELVNDYFHGEYRQVPWYTVTMIAAATLYVLAPVDTIPDIIPLVGYIDDVMVVGLVWKGVEEDLRAFCKFKNYDESEFF